MQEISGEGKIGAKFGKVGDEFCRARVGM